MAPLDMRGSFDALAGAVRGLGLDPVDGHLYLFLNKRRRIAKALWFDGAGWCVLAKRLEAGSFQLPPLDGDKPQVVIDGSAFASLLAGIDFTAARRGWNRRPRCRLLASALLGMAAVVATQLDSARTDRDCPST
ncbi:MAG: IS66 family insertion sequence element accessory protein TnpB [Myxococcales bacterium]|nr:IS66 family insertion sequence element accessory protein TnpB [Myxococcales bacterium]